MESIKIAIVDTIGLTYDATTLDKFGLGGSESWTVYMARELQKIGFSVQVFNNCIDSRAAEGVYDGVEYIDLSRLHQPNDYTCDVMVSSRSIIPFIPEKHWGSFNYPASVFQKLKSSAKTKILMLHDTFCSGDHLLEEVVMDGHIDQIFTLSDWHTIYTTNSDHGRRRNFEVLKNKIFQTRNGARKYFDVDMSKKDPNHFVYNASITKGMLPLVLDIWPKVKKAIPTARLTVIGGYYRFRDGAAPDAQEVKWHELVARKDLKNNDITFTGVIPQKDIAVILANASLMLFPCAFPETFGISTLESMLYNTPLVTTRFGALEETAVDMACYKIDYAIEPNNLFQDINKEKQVQKFVDMVKFAHANTYLTMQKSNACELVKEVAGWDTVALQWKQQIYKTLGLFLPVDEYRQATHINETVHRVFGRRFTNPVEQGWRTTRERGITIVSPVFNSEKYIRDCILSVAQQNYNHYKHIIIDDASTDNTAKIARETIDSLPMHVRKKFWFWSNSENNGSVCNYLDGFYEADEMNGEIVMMLDGDDSLVNDPTIFNYYNELYSRTGAEFTYGSMWSKADNIPLIAQPYPKHVKDTKTYREHRFPWNMPYTHLRTFSAALLADEENNAVLQKACKDENGNWLRAGGDTAIFYTLIEAANPDKVIAVPHVFVNYNDLNPINDYKVNGAEQTKTAERVLTMKGNRRVQ